MTRILCVSDLLRLNAHIDAGTLSEFHATPKKRRKNEESRAQQAVVRWWDMACKQWGCQKWMLFAFPNGGRRDALTGFLMQKEGVRSGIPDLMLCVPHAQRSGLFLEMKTATGSLSPEQRTILPILQTLGYQTAVCRSAREAINVIEAYLNAPAARA